MKARMKFEIAQAAGMSSPTLSRWLKDHRAQLVALGVKPTQKLLPPKAVAYVCGELGIIEEDFFVA